MKKLLNNKIIIFLVIIIPLIIATIFFWLYRDDDNNLIDDYSETESETTTQGEEIVSFSYPDSWEKIGDTGFNSPEDLYELEIKAFYTLLDKENVPQIMEEFNSPTEYIKTQVGDKEVIYEESESKIGDTAIYTLEYYFETNNSDDNLARVTCYGSTNQREVIEEICGKFVRTLEFRNE